MGITCTLKSANEEQLLILRRNPKLVPVFFGDESWEEPASFWRRLFRGRTAIPANLLEQADCMEIELEKSWHGLHFLFTGTAEGGDLPAAFLLKGGDGLGSSGNRVVSAADARRFKDFVHSLSEDELRSRFDPERMTQLRIYPEEIWRTEQDEAFDYLLEYFEILWAFTRDVVDENLGYVLRISG